MILRKKFCFTLLLILAVCLALPSAADAEEGVPPVISTDALANGRVGVIYSQTLAADGTSIIWRVGNGALPNDLVLNNNGVISGTPATVGTFSFTVEASNDIGVTTKPLSITIDRPVHITTNSLRDGYVDWHYSQHLAAEGAQPITWTIVRGNLPRGLDLFRYNGEISGWPRRGGWFRFTVRASNNWGYDQKDFEIYVWGSDILSGGCSAGVGRAAAITLLIGIMAAHRYRKNKNRKQEARD